MALRTNLFNETIFKVVEINNVLALRTGHILAQAELPKQYFLAGNSIHIENGEIVFLGVDGKLATRNQLGNNPAKLELRPFLIYNEELMTGPYTDLKYFAEVFDSANKAYPRCLGLEVGDSFTTNNYAPNVSGTAFNEGIYAIINDDGKLQVRKNLTVAYTGPLFAVVPTTLPDGVTEAYEFTVIALKVTLTA
jgi:hypothetical protein